MKLVAACLLLLLTAGCATPVTGTASSSDKTTTVEPTTTTVKPPPVKTATPKTTTPKTTTEATATKPATTTRGIPAIDESAPAQYCDQRFKGALGKDMHAVVVETPSGRVNCDQAGAILFDYYAERSTPDPALPPLDVAGFTCGQVAEPALPQVVCTDGDSLIYSMWPQGG
ncbi:hypothetical protein [Alloactinosynnema sp. L-07]|uniref:hypothetical protein n=1 Tax=Alloactinosynnema sp. L-07 TaxID=1653480 RepID=UPI00065F0517|nr:hypothetical protein [Alloactinosynnema sp. L-07]CRK61781.1 hypothetical protein [Alloactinosynnema sp. L-07]